MARYTKEQHSRWNETLFPVAQEYTRAREAAKGECYRKLDELEDQYIADKVRLRKEFNEIEGCSGTIDQYGFLKLKSWPWWYW